MSSYDYAADKGVYIYHVTNATSNLPHIDVECADGNWDFNFDETNLKITRVSPNPSGDDEMNVSFDLNNTTYACYTPIYHENSAWGDSEDAFDLEFNNVFSPLSNPRSINNQSLDFTIEVKNKIGSLYKLQLYFTDPYDGKPSKPQNLIVGPSSNMHPLLVWYANIEPDLNNYKIYKKSSISSNWQHIATTTDTSYEDLTEDYLIWDESFSTYVYYAVSAVDSSSLESVKSDAYKTKVKGDHQIEKKNFDNNHDDFANIEITEYSLESNYPNPFNPSTTISYSLPVNGHVVLKIYNSLGQEVQTLVNEIKDKGIYKVNFDASSLHSGVYIYSVQANDFMQNKKMILLK